MRAVIFNADDFGANAVTNAAIVRAHREGILTSASVMVNEPGVDEAVALARENPDLAVGLHVVLSSGRPALPRNEVDALVREDGRFPDDPAMAGLRAFFRPAARRQIRREIAAQFERFARTGLNWSHVDGHQHLHLHPVIWDALVEQCQRYSVRWVRIPYEEYLPFTGGRRAARRMEWLFFRALRRRCLRSLKRTRLRTADRVYGHLETGRVSEDYLLSLLPRLNGTINEVYSHPGAPNAQEKGLPGDGVDVELQGLLSNRVMRTAHQLGLRPTNYRLLDAESVTA